jgi:hypothetical protein
MMLKNRRKVLRLKSPAPPNRGNQDSDEEDPDFSPASDDEIGDAAKAGQRCNRKRHRNQMRGHRSCATAPPPTPAASASVPLDPKRRPVSIRCSPSKFTDIFKALDENLKAQVRAKNFGGLLLFKPQSLDRQLLSWLMRKLNPETMKLEIGGGKEIAITKHGVWCVFQIPNAGSDPPLLKDDEARVKRRELGVQICGSAFNPNIGIKVSDIENGFKNRTLTGDLGLKAFFMCAFQSLLFSNTDSYIRLEDVRFTEDF